MNDPLIDEDDVVVPFIFEKLPVRGAVIQLKSSWARMQLGQDYGNSAAAILGQSAAATALIAQSLKFKGKITLQLNGNGPLSMLVMQCSDQLEIRGMVTAPGIPDDIAYADLTRGCRCAVTVDSGSMERPYQGIVEVIGDTLSYSFENYFKRSVQLPSHMSLIADRSVCGGILLQQMPDLAAPLVDDWQRLGLLAATLRLVDIQAGVGASLIGNLFSEDDVRIYGSRPAVFRCRCSRERAAEVLRLLGPEEAREVCAERGRVDVSCEYCGQVQTFDAVDVTRLFAGQDSGDASTIH